MEKGWRGTGTKGNGRAEIKGGILGRSMHLYDVLEM